MTFSWNTQLSVINRKPPFEGGRSWVSRGSRCLLVAVSFVIFQGLLYAHAEEPVVLDREMGWSQERAPKVEVTLDNAGTTGSAPDSVSLSDGRTTGASPKAEVIVSDLERDVKAEIVNPEEAIPRAEGAPETAAGPSDSEATSDIEIPGRQVLQINQSLRRMIEENESLRRERDELDKSLRTVRGQRQVEQNRVESAIKERDHLRDEMERVTKLNEEFRDQLLSAQKALAIKESWLEMRLKEMASGEGMPSDGEGFSSPKISLVDDQEGLSALVSPQAVASTRFHFVEDQLGVLENAVKDNLPVVDPGDADHAAAAAGGAAVPASPVTRDVMAVMDELSRTQKQMAQDEGQVHYNRGNKFFHSGQYVEAAKEYRLAVEKYPENANAHFNLAYVSGEFIKDFETAVKHYRLYLMLNPMASDESLVKEKIIEAELILKSVLEKSESENLWQKKRGEIYTR